MKRYLLSAITLVFLFNISCNQSNKEELSTTGTLYIIGGGKRPVSMIDEIIDISGLRQGGYLIVLPMASEEPDSASFYSTKQFKNRGISNAFAINFTLADTATVEKLDSLRKAKLIYIAGGDQNLFMKVVQNNPIQNAIIDAYKNGAVIAGTSAGAAVMSKKMITGNQLKFPEDSGYKAIHSNNIEIKEGLGLVSGAIIDQHFIRRERMNRLISVAIENPDELCIGIDESTAIMVKGDSAKVCGISQVVVISASCSEIHKTDSIIAGKNLRLDILYPGQKFIIK